MTRTKVVFFSVFVSFLVLVGHFCDFKVPVSNAGNMCSLQKMCSAGLNWGGAWRPSVKLNVI